MPVKIDSPIVNWTVVKEEEPKPVVEEVKPVEVKPVKRPSVLRGETHKLVNNSKGYNLYITINYLEDKPYEVFFTSSHTDAAEWVTGLSRLISVMLQSGTGLDHIGKQLFKVHSDQGYHAGGKGGFVAGIVQHIGKTLLHIHKQSLKATESLSVESEKATPSEDIGVTAKELVEASKAPGEPCPECGETMTKLDGCWTCTACGYSKCS